MKMRALTAAAVLAISLLLSGCGGVFLFTTGTEGANIIVVSGTCTSVQTTNVVGNSGFIVVTGVTLFNNGLSSTYNFCGNVASQFPLNSFLTVTFTSGTSCATTNSIVIG